MGDAAPAGPAAMDDPADDEEPDGAAVPAFLAARSTRPRPSPKRDDRVQRDDVVPSWEIDGRYGAQAGSEPHSGDGPFSRLLTIAAVVIILALGVAAVILVPGLLSGSPQQTMRPSFSAVPRSPSPAASGLVVLPSPTGVPLTTPSPNPEPTAAPTSEASPRLYKIKSGDTLAKIARREDTTVADIMAANPQISDPNDIRRGEFIVIPSTAPPP
jgi:LysM repeat protein